MNLWRRLLAALRSISSPGEAFLDFHVVPAVVRDALLSQLAA